jgi:copper chaperone CopZ
MITVLKIKQIAKEGLRCRNLVQQDFGNIQGVFGVRSDMINGIVEVTHTDEVSVEILKRKLNEMGYDVE